MGARVPSLSLGHLAGLCPDATCSGSACPGRLQPRATPASHLTHPNTRLLWAWNLPLVTREPPGVTPTPERPSTVQGLMLQFQIR